MVLDPDATESQQDGARAAIDLWNRRASTRLTVSQAPPESVNGAASPTPGPPALPLHFRQAAALSHGFFDPASGQILINLDLADHELAVTIAHEVGHAFGLVHVTGRPSVMTSGNLVVEPNEGDVAELSKLWGACAPAAPPTP